MNKPSWYAAAAVLIVCSVACGRTSNVPSTDNSDEPVAIENSAQSRRPTQPVPTTWPVLTVREDCGFCQGRLSSMVPNIALYEDGEIYFAAADAYGDGVQSVSRAQLQPADVRQVTALATAAGLSGGGRYDSGLKSRYMDAGGTSFTARTGSELTAIHALLLRRKERRHEADAVNPEQRRKLRELVAELRKFEAAATNVSTSLRFVVIATKSPERAAATWPGPPLPALADSAGESRCGVVEPAGRSPELQRRLDSFHARPEVLTSAGSSWHVEMSPLPRHTTKCSELQAWKQRLP